MAGTSPDGEKPSQATGQQRVLVDIQN
jgi:hypothetical protein